MRAATLLLPLLLACGARGKVGELNGPCNPDGTCSYSALRCDQLSDGMGHFDSICLVREERKP